MVHCFLGCSTASFLAVAQVQANPMRLRKNVRTSWVPLRTSMLHCLHAALCVHALITGLHAGPSLPAGFLQAFTTSAPCAGVIRVDPDGEPCPPYSITYNQVHRAMPRSDRSRGGGVRQQGQAYSRAAAVAAAQHRPRCVGCPWLPLFDGR